MKKRLSAFLAGMLTTALVCGLTISALAANGLLTIDVDPSVTIKVNGEVFQPKNEQGEDVMVFKYNGTTYAPVRALAEAYGLEVGFDQSSNMATVDKSTTPDTTAAPVDNSEWTPEEEVAYQKFKGLWEVGRVADDKSFIGLRCYKLDETGGSVSEAERIGESAVDTFLAENTVEFVERCCLRFDFELYQQYRVPEIRYAFELYGSWGWPDRLSSDGWECGYRAFLEYSN